LPPSGGGWLPARANERLDWYRRAGQHGQRLAEQAWFAAEAMEAARRLKLARRLRDEGAREAADEDIRKVIKTHPRTHAAEEGRHFLSGTAQ